MSRFEFDRIAEVYDDTRRPLDDATLAGLKEILTYHGCHSILEIAVGTGRISSPLAKAGFDMIGLDISRRMMEKARAKGLSDLLLAEASHIPLRKKTVDATFMAHVFHLLEDPLTVMRTAAQVSRVGVFALVRKRLGNWPWFAFFGGEDSSSPEGGEGTDAARRRVEERRARFSQIAEKYHWSWSPERHARNWRREHDILETNHPDELRVVSDVVVTDTLEERIDRLQKGAYSFMVNMPPEMKREMIEMMRADAASFPGLASRRRHEVFQVGFWRSESL
ncbi:MAG TPA: class I SAM-dependent methyltransferase [Nitrososphaerales archaeon]|nr:class I SAM-dependent methyltransferase [Nitrososphaerales archaeon]